jgi:hypothetical protein
MHVGTYLKKLKILCLQSQHILPLLILVVNNKGQYKVNSEIHNINTRQNSNLHLPSSNSATYQTGIYCCGKEIFNNQPSPTKNLSNNTTQFKSDLQSYLCTNSFHSLCEYFKVNIEWKCLVYYPKCSFWTKLLLF